MICHAYKSEIVAGSIAPWPRIIRKIWLCMTLVAVADIFLFGICEAMTRTEPDRQQLGIIKILVAAMVFIPCITAVIIWIRMRRLRQSLILNSGRLCLSCEYPLPINPRVSQCSECGCHYELLVVRQCWRRVSWRRIENLRYMRRGQKRFSRKSDSKALKER